MMRSKQIHQPVHTTISSCVYGQRLSDVTWLKSLMFNKVLISKFWEKTSEAVRVLTPCFTVFAAHPLHQYFLALNIKGILCVYMKTTTKKTWNSFNVRISYINRVISQHQTMLYSFSVHISGLPTIHSTKDNLLYFHTIINTSHSFSMKKYSVQH